MEKRRVVVTGLGTVNPTGNSTEESWENIRRGKSGIGRITRFDTADMAVKTAGELKDFDPAKRLDRHEIRHMGLFSQYALYAAEEAVEMAGLSLSKETPDDRTGVLLSTGIGGLSVIEENYSRGMEKGFDRVSPFFIPMAISNMAAAQIAIRFGCRGMCSSTVTACAGGSNAIGDAFHRIRDGYEETMICGGTEAAITPLAVGGFAVMKALCREEDSTRASIPFDKNRSGFVMGEGGAVLVLEALEHAKARGAKIYDIDKETLPREDLEALQLRRLQDLCARVYANVPFYRKRFEENGIAPADIDYINAHGTSTKMNDALETAAIKTVFGERAYEIPVSSTKSMTGHLLGAAGGVEAVFCVKAIEDQFVPMTVGYQDPDPECDLDYVTEGGREKPLTYVLSDNLGFGGHNAVLIFKKAED